MFWMVVLLAAGFHLGWRMTLSMMPLYIAGMNISPGWFGAFISTASFLSLFMAIPVGRFADQYGTGTAVRYAMGTGMAALVSMLLFPGVATGWIAYALLGVAMVGISVTTQAAIGAATPLEMRDRAFATYAMALGVSNMLGPVVAGYIVEWAGFDMLFVTSLVVMGVSILFAYRLPSSQGSTAAAGGHGPDDHRLGQLLRNVRIRRVLILGFLAIMMTALNESYVPYYLQSIGYSSSLVGTLLSVGAGTAVVVRGFMGPLIDRFGRRAILSAAVLVGAAGIALVPLGAGLPLHVVAMISLGTGHAVMAPLTMSMMTQYAGPGEFGLLLGLRMTANRTSAMLTPVLFGLAATVLGMTATFVATGGLLITVGWGLLFRPPPADKT